MLTKTAMTPRPADAGFAEALAGLRQNLRAFLRKRMSNADLAEDVLQDVFLKALLAHRAGRRIDNLSGWLYAAARTTLADHYRSQGVSLEELDDEMPAGDPDEPTMHQELSACLQPFIARLPALYRDTLMASELQGRSLRSLAAEQGVTVSAIKSRAARGRAMLRKALLECCHVEVRDGLVSDYQRKPSSACRGKCA